uniref:Fibronectin type-III domain-containing protein n=1 Tax=Anopheles coluzzii TaxID=1518534 RepID=A0A8W7NZA4_ANOCL
LRTYNIIVRGVDLRTNYSKVLSNVTIEATSSTLLLANLTEGVTYTVSVAAATSAGMGPFSNPATLRLDPITKQLDQTSHRYPINHNNMDDILTQPWFIAVLGCILVLMMLSFGAMVFVKRKHMMMKQSALTSLRAHAAGGVVKIPRNDSLWMDPSGMVWGHQSTGRGKDHIQDYAPVGTSSTLPLEQQQQHTMLHHNRTRYVEYTDYPSDYAEVSSFNPPTSDGMNHLSAQLNGSRAPSEYSSAASGNASAGGGYHHLVPSQNGSSNGQSSAASSACSASSGSSNSSNGNDGVRTYDSTPPMSNKTQGTRVPRNGSSSNRFKLSRTPIVSSLRSALKQESTSGEHANQPALHQEQRKKMSSLNNLGQKQQLYIKVGETGVPGCTNSWNPSTASAMAMANLYQNTSVTMPSGASNGDPNVVIYLPTGNRSVISYRAGSEFGDDV